MDDTNKTLALMDMLEPENQEEAIHVARRPVGGGWRPDREAGWVADWGELGGLSRYPHPTL